MPIHTGQDKNGKFYQWGKTGKKYYFKPEDKESKQRALNKAKKQQTAIYSSGWKGDTMKLVKIKKGDADIGAILDKLAASAEVIESSSNSSWNKMRKQYDTFKKIEDFLGDQDKDKLRRLSARIRDAIGQTEALFNDLKKYEETVDDNWR